MIEGPPVEAWEVELDTEETRVRRWRQKQLEQVGFSEFTAFRLSMVNDWHRAEVLLKRGATEDFVIDQLID